MIIHRIYQEYLAEMLEILPAISLNGAKAVGKTFVARKTAKTTFELDNLEIKNLISAGTSLLTNSPKPILLDEWQYSPELWNLVRRAVDNGAENGSYILTGSAYPSGAAIHSGAGRIVNLKMRPLTLQEKFPDFPRVSIRQLLSEDVPQFEFATDFTIQDYIHEICTGGLPRIWMEKNEQARNAHFAGYIENIMNKEMQDLQGANFRQPNSLLSWMKSYAAAVGSSASYSEILEAAALGVRDKPSYRTITSYLDFLANIWVLDEISMWLPSSGTFGFIKQTPKHFLMDTGLTTKLLGFKERDFLTSKASTPFDQKYGALLGRLFEALVAVDLQTYAVMNDCELSYLRADGGRHEVDFILHSGRKIIGIEVKMSSSLKEDDVKHLLWLRKRYDSEDIVLMVIYTGKYAYTRQDGIHVVPACLLGV
jgi:predicted AAA+ superfamily ATPase